MTAAKRLHGEETLDGGWEPDPQPDQHDYRYHRAGPVAVRFQDGFEPDGELVTSEPVHVHIEQMSAGAWWIGLSWGDRESVAIDFFSKSRISVRWRDER